MPYINSKRREKYDPVLDILVERMCDVCSNIELGDVNYVITQLCLRVIPPPERLGYAALNNIIGVLTCVQHELYRRVVANYEDQKCKENGDVFDPAEPK